jgi:retron-type reverse transcriptase
LIQQSLLQVLQVHFEALFSEHSYGFRPGRSAHDAVKAAQGYVAEGTVQNHLPLIKAE